MISTSQLKQLAKEHGTPIFVIDHEQLRKNYAQFKKHLPRVQAYYAVKANSDPEIVRTLYKAGASFDVASMAEFRLVYDNIKSLSLPRNGRRSFGTRSSTPIRSKTSPRSKSWINTSRWLRTTITPKFSSSRSTLLTRA